MQLPELLIEIDQLKKEIDALRPVDKELEQRIMQKFRLDWNYHSNHIEGNSLTYGETKTFLLHGLTAQGKPLKDHLDIKGHNEGIHALEDIIKNKRPLTETFIRELHQVILPEPYEVSAITADGLPTTKKIIPGKYKTLPNHVKTVTGEMFFFATPEETPAKMGDLMKWYNTVIEDPNTHPLIIASEFHYRFVRIHPFDDGNGRMARLLMNLVLMKKGFPPVVIKTEKKKEYYRALQQADGGSFDAFVEYIGEHIVSSLELFIRGAKGEKIYEDDDFEKKLLLLEKELHPKVYITLGNPDKILEVINDFYLPCLERLHGKLMKIEKYFYNKHISYHDSLTELNHTFAVKNFEKLNSNLLYTIKKHLSSDFDFNKKYWISTMIIFEKYKQPKNEFTFETRLNISFEKYTYCLELEISQPTYGHFLNKILNRLENQFSKDIEEKELFISKKIFESNYDNKSSKEDIVKSVNSASLDVIDYFEKKAKEKL